MIPKPYAEQTSEELQKAQREQDRLRLDIMMSSELERSMRGPRLAFNAIGIIALVMLIATIISGLTP